MCLSTLLELWKNLSGTGLPFLFSFFVFHWPYCSVFPSSLLLIFFATVFPPQYCFPLQLLDFVTHLLYVSSSIAFHIFFPFSLFLSSPRWLDRVNMLAEKTIVTSTRKHPNLFASRQKFKCLCMYVCALRVIADIRKGKIPHSFPAPSLCLAQGLIRPRKTGPCPPLCHICAYAYMLVCVHAPLCVCACVPIFPPCGQVTIANQACEPCLKRPREREGGGRVGKWLSAFLCPHHWSRDKDDWRDGWLETRGQKLRD